MNEIPYTLFIDDVGYDVVIIYNVYPLDGDGWNTPIVPTEYEIIGYDGIAEIAPGTVWAAIDRDRDDIFGAIRYWESNA